eukprot:scaffold123105_cov30-Tisochrysis_lutea.AAC.17
MIRRTARVTESAGRRGGARGATGGRSSERVGAPGPQSDGRAVSTQQDDLHREAVHPRDSCLQPQGLGYHPVRQAAHTVRTSASTYTLLRAERATQGLAAEMEANLGCALVY